MREFLSLIMQFLEDSHLFCGKENRKFVSFNSTAVKEGDYKFAGTLIAMSMVHGGPSPQFLAPPMFEAIVSDNPMHVAVAIEDIPDWELQEAILRLSSCTDVKDAIPILQEGILTTLIDLSGTYIQVKTLESIQEIIRSVTQWYIIGRSVPAIENFKEGLSALGVLEAIRTHPAVFRTEFCPSLVEVKLTADTLDGLFSVTSSDVGSTRAVTESLVLSRWRDYLQDLEDKEDAVSRSDVLFFATGCHSLPPRKKTMNPTIEFLHLKGQWGFPRYPNANVCSSTSLASRTFILREF
ncbi:predicted protein [Nematostella vectensis]|uniref:HECT domain-containing protein n=1 Tax=Nematostella vectensis TaxID=45351 RepID=A7T1Z9_NEMVE|nr:predicted protein [Nematostella vectensis]|eukprot:XP_001622115.1 predicted protein [Nematostella vectensis]